MGKNIEPNRKNLKKHQDENEKNSKGRKKMEHMNKGMKIRGK